MEVTYKIEVHNNITNGSKGADILNDLLVIIKSITKGHATFSFRTIETILECCIKVSTYIPTLTVFYNNDLKDVAANNFNLTNSKTQESSFPVYKDSNFNFKKMVETKSYQGSLLSTQVIRKNWEQTKKLQDVLHDLLVLINLIIKGHAFISSVIDESVSIYRINSSDFQHGVILSYKNHIKDGGEKEVELLNETKIVNLTEFPREDPLRNSLSKESNENRIVKGETPYTCTYCEKTFKNTLEKEIHERAEEIIRRDHSNKSHDDFNKHDKTLSGNIHKPRRKKLHFCNFCDKICMSNSDRKVHERTHTGERPFACTICDKCFCTSTERRKHERIHTGEITYACSYCDKTFSTFSKKRMHERTHLRLYACSSCDKSFEHKRDLKKHQRTHSDKRNHICNYCGKPISSSKELHERIHLGETLYVCSYCNLRFKDYYNKHN